MEYIAVFAGIISVWYSRKENILVYPTGSLNTIIYIYLSFKGGLLGEASVNFYYTVMSVYGWLLWTRKDKHATHGFKNHQSFFQERMAATACYFSWHFTLYFFCINCT